MPDIQIPKAEQRRRKRKRQTLIGAGIAVAIGVALLIYFLLPTGAAVSRSDLLIASVDSGPLAIRVQAPGTLKPEVLRWITASSPGVAEDVKVLPGDHVKADSVLAVLANPKLKSAVIAAQSDLANAKATLVSTRATLKNDLLSLQGDLATARSNAKAARLKEKAEKNLVDQHVVSTLDYARTKLDADNLDEQAKLSSERVISFKSNMTAQMQAQKAKVDALSAALDEAQAEVAALTVRAGLAGVVQAVPVQNGQTLSLGGNIARIASLKKLKAVLQVPPSEAGELTDGQKVDVTLNVGSNTILHGEVARVAPSVSNGSVNVDVSLPGDLPAGARPNLSVSGTIDIATLKQAVYVQRPVYSQPNSTQTLYKLVAGGDAAVPVQVKFGRASDQAIQILSGLKSGDQVIVSDTSDFAGGKRVRIR
ncbi:MAG: efflux RND transporter periplasmic adaptor subunit [Gammaproteobacteria bacterium]